MTYLELWFRAIVEPTFKWIGSLPTELRASLSDPGVWAAFGTALILGTLAGVIGLWVARRLQFVDPSSPVSESIAVGLSVGLVAMAAVWATIGSGGRSAFTPIGIAFLVVVGVAVLSPAHTAAATVENSGVIERSRGNSRSHHRFVLAACGLFVVVTGLVYGSTLAPSPRSGLQPVEFIDESYYAVLGADLAETGTESLYSPSGWDNLTGVPEQSWYHWGEIWLASGVIKFVGLAPMLARHYVVLPLILLAVALLTGTIVRRISSDNSQGAFTTGAVAGLFLAPMPLILTTFFGWWPRGGFYGITQYGLAVVVVLLVLYPFATERGTGRLGPSLLVATVTASLVPAHVVLASLAFAGVLVVWGLRMLQRHRPGPPLKLPPTQRATIALTLIVGVLAVFWGVVTGHGVAASGFSPALAPFGGAWLEAVLATILSGGVLLSVPLTWLAMRRAAMPGGWLLLATCASVVVGAVIWGIRVADFNSFHFFYGAVLVFGTPVAAIAVWTLVIRFRRSGRAGLASIVLIAFAAQIGVGVVAGVQRLRAFGGGAHDPIPIEILAAIRSLPAGSKLAYSCAPFEEIAFWGPQLGSIDAHTGRPAIPMCFQADLLTSLNGVARSAETAHPLFLVAPQRILFPDADASPSAGEIARFLKEHDVQYLYVDAEHPNALVPDAMPVAISGSAQVLRIP